MYGNPWAWVRSGSHRGADDDLVRRFGEIDLALLGVNGRTIRPLLNCHARVTSGEIDIKFIQIYKSNLSVVVNGYGGLECRVLEHFVYASAADTILLDVSHVLLIKPFLDDELLIFVGPGFGALWFEAKGPGDEPTKPDEFAGSAEWA